MSVTLSQVEAFNVSTRRYSRAFSYSMFYMWFAVLMAMPWFFGRHLNSSMVFARIFFDLLCAFSVFSFSRIDRRLKAKIAEGGADTAFLVRIRAKLVALIMPIPLIGIVAMMFGYGR